MQLTKITKKHCNECGKEQKFEKHTARRGAGDILLTFFSLGAWWILRKIADQPYRCSVCGSK